MAEPVYRLRYPYALDGTQVVVNDITFDVVDGCIIGDLPSITLVAYAMDLGPIEPPPPVALPEKAQGGGGVPASKSKAASRARRED